MNWSNLKKLMTALALLVVIPAASAQSADQLTVKYTGFATSSANATALVDGLRRGAEIVMAQSIAVPPPPPPSFMMTGTISTTVVNATLISEVKCTPQTGDMGFGNVDQALSLAQSVLAAIHIVETPTKSYERRVKPADICAALTGGKVAPKGGADILLIGILQLRADGLGWGEIARDPRIRLAH